MDVMAFLDVERSLTGRAWRKRPGNEAAARSHALNHGLSDTAFLWMISELKDRNLLALNDACIVRALDAKDAERYPAGVLENSRTWFWKMIGCPVPRPIGIISDTEWVHESAWGRRGAAHNRVAPHQNK